MKGPNTKESGSFYGKRGNELERSLVELFNNQKNLSKLKEEKMKTGSIFNLILKRLLKDNNISLKDVSNLLATNSIPQLKNRGHAKTDICVTIKTKSEEQFLETISIKNSTKPKVSCHDYPAKDFIRVLKCKSTRLAYYLGLFQQFPSYRGFESNLEEGYSTEEFVRLLSEKSKIFTEWALKGMHDTHNLTSPDIQISKYLLLVGSEKMAFYSMDEYIEIITTRDKSRFGVPFSWTYPSKQRGKRIQLKVPIFFE